MSSDDFKTNSEKTYALIARGTKGRNQFYNDIDFS